MPQKTSIFFLLRFSAAQLGVALDGQCIRGIILFFYNFCRPQFTSPFPRVGLVTLTSSPENIRVNLCRLNV